MAIDDPRTLARIERVRDWIAGAERVVVFTGAGISTDSGVPDYRGPQGVWTRNPGAERMATIDHYLNDPDVRRASWRNRLTSPMWDAQPNVGHHAVAYLHRIGKLDTLITQNVDGLHHKSGVPADRVVELHGNIRDSVCWSCGDRLPMQVVLDRVRAGEDDPRCERLRGTGACGGILKSATVSFGQNLDPKDLERAFAAADCDVLLAVGSTLTVYPAAGVVPEAKRAGATVVILNAEPTPFDRLADAVIHAPISEALPALVGMPV